MKKAILATLIFCLALVLVHGGLKPGDAAVPFSLLNIDGTFVSLSDFSNQKGVILIFTCNSCPFSRAYEDRIIQLHNKYADMGFPIVAINSNNPERSPEDSFSHMRNRALEKGFEFPYLKDRGDEISTAYGVTRTPHVFLLEKSGGNLRIAYTGAIDDNVMDARSVSNRYLENAIRALTTGKRPDPDTTRPIGCTIKN